MKSHESSRRALNLSLAVYRVTANFPIGEVLTRQLRLLANQIAAELSSANATLGLAGDIALNELTGIDKKINRLLTYFKIASRQNWVRVMNWTVLSFEYIKLKQEISLLSKKEEEEEAMVMVKEEKAAKNISLMSHNIKREAKVIKEPLPKIAGLSERQGVILTKINKRQLVKSADLTPLFKNVSERTLRNDLRFLLEKKLIRREGFNKTATYLSK